MTTTVTLTGTGVPYPEPGRAGSGVLVRHNEIALQFDAGRATTLRLAEAGVRPDELTALFVTHVHHDHVVALPDLTLTRWVQGAMFPNRPLPIVAPAGDTAQFIERMLEPFERDVALRSEHLRSPPPEFALHRFAVPTQPEAVWRSEGGSVAVTAVGVHHEPVRHAVAYRVDTADGAVVISGDTRVCREVEKLSQGADLLVHEACRSASLASAVKGTLFEEIFEYHADTVSLGTLAERASVPHTVLTHLIPAPASPEEEEAFAEDLRCGGYTGDITVGRDLMTFDIGENGD